MKIGIGFCSYVEGGKSGTDFTDGSFLEANKMVNNTVYFWEGYDKILKRQNAKIEELEKKMTLLYLSTTGAVQKEWFDKRTEIGFETFEKQLVGGHVPAFQFSPGNCTVKRKKTDATRDETDPDAEDVVQAFFNRFSMR